MGSSAIVVRKVQLAPSASSGDDAQLKLGATITDEELRRYYAERGVPLPSNFDSASDERTVNNTMRHQYRVLSDEEKVAMTRLKDIGLNFLDSIDDMVPKGREASLAKTKIEEAVMWAVRGLTG